MTPETLAQMRAAAEKATKGTWYTVEQPWLPHGQDTYVIAGHYDPHVGEQICDFNDAAMAGVEDKYEDDQWSARNWSNAAHIAASCPANVLALLDERDRLAAEVERLRDDTPNDLRAMGWAVAVHNDYRLNGQRWTFWLLTKGDRCFKGEAQTDHEALNQIRARAALDPAR